MREKEEWMPKENIDMEEMKRDIERKLKEINVLTAKMALETKRKSNDHYQSPSSPSPLSSPRSSLPRLSRPSPCTHFSFNKPQQQDKYLDSSLSSATDDHFID